MFSLFNYANFLFFVQKRIKQMKIHEFILISNDVPSFSAHCLEIDPGWRKKWEKS